MSEQSRSLASLAAAANDLAAAARAARNINRWRGCRAATPRDPVNIDALIEALTHIHTITGHLAQTVMRYAEAVRIPFAGYSGSGATPEHPASYAGPVAGAAADAAYTLTTLAKQLAYGAPVGPSTDALASLDVALAHWRSKNRPTGGDAQ